MKISRFTAGAMLTVVLALAACQQQKAPEPEATPAAGEAPAGPEAKPGLSVANGTLVLPAVKGNPGVAYFDVVNLSDKPTAVAAVFIDGAGKAEMHETKRGSMAPLPVAEVGAGATVRFERGGKHVMVFDLADRLKAGGTAEMTLTFSGGDKLSAPLKVEAAGGAM